jgi:hypothetical protein
VGDGLRRLDHLARLAAAPTPGRGVSADQQATLGGELLDGVGAAHDVADLVDQGEPVGRLASIQGRLGRWVS